jgi:predicted RNase H-like HicB family nuclease
MTVGSWSLAWHSLSARNPRDACARRDCSRLQAARQSAPGAGLSRSVIPDSPSDYERLSGLGNGWRLLPSALSPVRAYAILDTRTSAHDGQIGGVVMLLRYIQVALDRAHYEIIEDEEPFYAEVPGLEGVWATGQSLEECRRNLTQAIEDWLLFSIAKGLPIPVLEGALIRLPERVEG